MKTNSTIESKKKIYSDSLVQTVGIYLIKLKGLIFLPLTLKAIGIENYGIFTQITVNLAMVSPFCTFAMGSSLNRFSSVLEDGDITGLRRDFWSALLPSLIFTILISGGLFLLSPYICHFLFKTSNSSILWATRLSSFMVIERMVWEILNKYLTSRKRFKENTFLTLIYKFVPYVGLIFGFVVWRNILHGIAFYLALETFFTIILFVIVVRPIGFQMPDIGRFKQFFSYSWTLTLSSFEGSLLAKVDRYFIAQMMGPAAVGVYNIIYSVVSMLEDISLPFRRYYATYLPKLWDEGQKESAMIQIRSGMKYFFLISWSGLIFSTLLLKPATELFFHKELPHAPHFNLLVFITGIGIIGEGTSRFYNQVIHLNNQNHYQMWYRIISVIINMILNFFLIPPLGLLGAGIATCISYVLIVLLNDYQFSLGADRSYYWNLLKMGLAIVPGAIMFFLIHPNSPFVMLGVVGIVLTSYLILLFVFRAITVDELKSILLITKGGDKKQKKNRKVQEPQ